MVQWNLIILQIIADFISIKIININVILYN